MEIWKDVEGHAGYQVSNLGNLRCRRRQNGRLPFIDYYRPIKGVVNSKGYRMTAMDGKLKKVSRLVAHAFLGPSKLQVNHVDGDKLNDALLNLEYCTASQNVLHAYKLGLSARGTNHHKNKLTTKQVRAIFKSEETSRKLAAQFGVSQGVIMGIKHKRIWKHLHE